MTIIPQKIDIIDCEDGDLFNASVKYYPDQGILEVYKMDKARLKGSGGGRRGRSEKLKGERGRYQQQAAIRAGTTIRELVISNDLRYLWTLTYRDAMTDRWQVTKDFKEFMQRLNYRIGESLAYVAVLEIQEKRAQRTGKNVFHVHLATNVFIDKKVVEDAWGHGFTFVSKHTGELLRVASYMSKYVKKGFEDKRVRVAEKKRYFNSKGLKRPPRKAMYLSMDQVRELEEIAHVKQDYEGASWLQVRAVDEKGIDSLLSYFKEPEERTWRVVVHQEGKA